MEILCDIEAALLGWNGKPYPSVLRLMSSLIEEGNTVIFCTLRNEKHREDVKRFLHSHQLPSEALYMRQDNDLRNWVHVKEGFLKTLRDDGYRPSLVIDACEQSIDMFRSYGMIGLYLLLPFDIGNYNSLRPHGGTSCVF